MLENQPDSPVYLLVAGYKIKITFGSADFRFFRKKFITEFTSLYSGFITKNNNSNTSYEIIFTEKPIIKTLRNKKKEQFIVYFEQLNNKIIRTFYHISIFQFQLILKYIILKLLKNSGFVLHASASIINNKAFIFTGPKNIGKSTTVRLLNSKFKAIADDSVIIKKEKESNNFFCYQTPFLEKEYWIKKSTNKYLISKIFFLDCKYKSLIKMIKNKKTIISLLINQTLLPDKERSKLQLKRVLEFTGYFDNFYYLNHYDNHERLTKYLSKLV